MFGFDKEILKDRTTGTFTMNRYRLSGYRMPTVTKLHSEDFILNEEDDDSIYIKKGETTINTDPTLNTAF